MASPPTRFPLVSLCAALVLLVLPEVALSQQTVQIVNRWYSSQRLSVDDSSAIGVDGTGHDAWVVSSPSGRSLIRNLATGKFLTNTPDEGLHLGSIITGMIYRNYSEWNLEPAASGFVRIKSKTGEYLHTENGRLEVGAIEPGWHSAMWALQDHSPPWYMTETSYESSIDILTRIDEAGYWSRSSTVFEASLEDDALFREGRTAFGTSGRRNEVGQHFQGVTYLKNGHFVAVHSLTSVDNPTVGLDGTCAAMVWTSPYSYPDRSPSLTAEVECGKLDAPHGGAIDSYGNYVVVPDWGFGVNDKIAFFDFSSGSPRSLDHLDIDVGNPGNAPSVGLSRRRADGYYYLTTAIISDHGLAPVTVYRAEEQTGGGACELTSRSCQFEEYGTLSSVYVSSSGMSLIDLAHGDMAILTMYSPDAVSADYMRGAVFDPDDLAAGVRTSGDSGENLGISQAQTKMARPSCRWACAVSIVDDTLYLVSIGRDVENDGDFELSIHDITDDD